GVTGYLEFEGLRGQPREHVSFALDAENCHADGFRDLILKLNFVDVERGRFGDEIPDGDHHKQREQKAEAPFATLARTIVSNRHVFSSFGRLPPARKPCLVSWGEQFLEGSPNDGRRNI